MGNQADRRSPPADTAPILFEPVLALRGKCFSLDSEGEAQLVLQVPEQFARVLSDNIHRLRDCSFVVRIDGLADGQHICPACLPAADSAALGCGSEGVEPVLERLPV